MKFKLFLLFALMLVLVNVGYSFDYDPADVTGNFSIIIDATSLSLDLVDYSMSVELNMTDFVGIQEFCQDLRAIWYNSTSTDYQFIPIGNLTECTNISTGLEIWFKAPLIELGTMYSLETSPYYMVWGNDTYVYELNNQHTFLVYDDFESGAINSSYWHLVGFKNDNLWYPVGINNATATNGTMQFADTDATWWGSYAKTKFTVDLNLNPTDGRAGFYTDTKIYKSVSGNVVNHLEGSFYDKDNWGYHDNYGNPLLSWSSSDYDQRAGTGSAYFRFIYYTQTNIGASVAYNRTTVGYKQFIAGKTHTSDGLYNAQAINKAEWNATQFRANITTYKDNFVTPTFEGTTYPWTNIGYETITSFKEDDATFSMGVVSYSSSTVQVEHVLIRKWTADEELLSTTYGILGITDADLSYLQATAGVDTDLYATINVSDAGYDIDYYSYGTNNTGAWANSTWTEWTGTATYLNVTEELRLNATVGANVTWMVYWNSTTGDYYQSDLQSIITIADPFNLTSSTNIIRYDANFTTGNVTDLGRIKSYRWCYDNGSHSWTCSSLITLPQSLTDDEENGIANSGGTVEMYDGDWGTRGDFGSDYYVNYTGMIGNTFKVYWKYRYKTGGLGSTYVDAYKTTTVLSSCYNGTDMQFWYDKGVGMTFQPYVILYCWNYDTSVWTSLDSFGSKEGSTVSLYEESLQSFDYPYQTEQSTIRELNYTSGTEIRMRFQYLNKTDSLFSSGMQFNTMSLVINTLTSQNYTVSQGGVQDLAVNITYLVNTTSTGILNINYNGTEYISDSIDCSAGCVAGEVQEETYPISIPGIATGEVYFNWTLTWDDLSSNITLSPMYNITILNLSVVEGGDDLCLRFRNESDRDYMYVDTLEAIFDIVYLDGTTLRYSFTNTTTNLTCFSTGTNNSVTVNARFQYVRDNYVYREYFLYHHILENTTTANVTMFELNDTVGTGIAFSVTDNLGLPLKDAYVSVQRFYTDINAYETIAMGVTDVNGETRIYLAPNDVYYIFTVTYEGDVIYVTEPMLVIGSTITFRVYPEAQRSIFLWRNIEYTLTFNAVTDTWRAVISDPSLSFTQICMEVKKTDLYGTDQLCYSCGSGIAMILTCTDASFSDRSQYAIALVGEGSEQLITLVSKTGTQWEGLLDSALIGSDGMVLTAMLVIASAGVGIFSPITAIILTIVALFVSISFSLTALTQGAIIGLAIVGGIIIWRMTK